MILASPHIQKNYNVSANELRGYGILILTRFSCWFFEKIFEVSMMGRSLLLAEVINKDLIVATAHFESLNNAKCRESQMNETFDIIKRSGIKNSIVVGDYNFCSSWTSEESVLK